MSDIVPNGYDPDFSDNPEHANGVEGFTVVGKFLDEDGWSPQRIDERYAYRTYYYGKNGEIRCYAQVRVDLQQYIFYAVATFRVTEEVRPMVAEYITRANYGLRIGNFEMDYSDGEVRYKSGIDFEGEKLTPNLVKNTTYPAVQTMDFYLPGLLKVAFGGKEPAEAIEEIENSA
jgi:hypothetical protein